MSEKRQKKKIVKTPSCEPDIQVDNVSKNQQFNSTAMLFGVRVELLRLNVDFYHFNDEEPG